jgi:hypothetical protein
MANRVGLVVVVLCDYAPHHGTNSIVFLLLNRIGKIRAAVLDSRSEYNDINLYIQVRGKI